VAVGTPDALAAESQILDRELERVAATRFRHGQRHYKGRSETSQFGGDFAVYHTDLMRSGAPRPVADVLAAAVPQIAERLPEYRVRRAWRALVGPEVSRRTQPQSLTYGCLHIIVDNTPWLSELTLRNPELTARRPAHASRRRLARSARRGVLRLRGGAAARAGRAIQVGHPAPAGRDQTRSEFGLPVDPARAVDGSCGSAGGGPRRRAEGRAAGA